MRFLRLLKHFGARPTAAIMVLGIVTLLVSPLNSALGQATSGDVVGTVLDTSGAVIPGATVTAKNLATGVVASSISSKEGEFRIPNLLAGNYDIVGAANGFATFTLKGFEVKLNTTATARLVLPVATASAKIEVSSDATAV